MKYGEKRNFFIIVSLISIVFFVLLVVFTKKQQGLLVVSFLNVGQGDAIFIEAPNGKQILIDSGPDSSVIRELGDVMPFWDRTIDMIIPTHADKDHIGGFPEVFKRFSIKSVYDSPNEATTAVYEAYQEGKNSEDVPVRVATSNDTIILDEQYGIYIRILFPDQVVEDLERNDSSTVTQLVYGDIEILLTGDAGSMIEEYLVYEYGSFLESEVLKAGHHGSKTSSSELFLQTVLPEYVVISAGENNSYGHPHKEVIDAIQNVGAKIFETKNGRIQFVTDGKEVWKK